jgi:hypothetical protein
MKKRTKQYPTPVWGSFENGNRYGTYRAKSDEEVLSSVKFILSVDGVLNKRDQGQAHCNNYQEYML